MAFHSREYYEAALERMSEARFLHSGGHYTLAMYVSGLASECMLRAFRVLRDPAFDERHDLWRLWKKTELSELGRGERHERIHAALITVRHLWHNDYRFKSANTLRSSLRQLKPPLKLKGDILKLSSKQLLEAAAIIVQFGGTRWNNLSKK